MSETAVNIFGKDRSELEESFQVLGLPRFRSGQVYEWLYKHRARDFRDMTNLSASLREQLAQRYEIRYPGIVKTSTSDDGTQKYLLETSKGYHIESVLIPAEPAEEGEGPSRLTLCLSTQVGCPLDCRFCATGSMQFRQNLSPGEIIGQYFAIESLHGERITNLVYMGMGEPLLNYDAVMQSIAIITDEANEGIGTNRITLSTAGIIPGIYRMAEENRNVKLAISLHTPDEATRTRLMPITEKYPLDELLAATEAYYKATKKPVTYEYILFDGVNDTEEDLRRLVKIARRVPSKVNVIPFHSIDAAYPDGAPLGLKPTPQARMDAFAAGLRSEDVTVMFRSSSGQDINAACGQLAVQNDHEKNLHSQNTALN